MEIIRAAHLGMCFGVRDAIDLAVKHAEVAPLTILGDLVHNPTVLRMLESRGITSTTDIAQANTPAVMVTAHGLSERRRRAAAEHGATIVDATCPLVQVAHRAVAALVRDGCHPVIIGQRGHVEVRGLTEDLDAFDVVLDDDDVRALPCYRRFGVAAQTTQPIERVRRIVDMIRARFPQSEVRFADTVCKPTKQRQAAASELARSCDVVVVVGGAHSNNTRELVDTCRQTCSRVHHAGTELDLRAEWFHARDRVGITAGTSTPDFVIDRVEARIRAFAPRDTSAPAGGPR